MDGIQESTTRPSEFRRLLKKMFSATILSLLLAFVAASDVTDLTADTFDAYVQKEPVALIEFFAPWCGHVCFNRLKIV